MIETFSIAVVARLTSLPIAVAAGILLLGVTQSLLTSAHVLNGRGVLGTALEQLKPNLSVAILFAALLVYRRLDVVGEDDAPPLPRGSRFRLAHHPALAAWTSAGGSQTSSGRRATAIALPVARRARPRHERRARAPAIHAGNG